MSKKDVLTLAKSSDRADTNQLLKILSDDTHVITPSLLLMVAQQSNHAAIQELAFKKWISEQAEQTQEAHPAQVALNPTQHFTPQFDRLRAAKLTVAEPSLADQLHKKSDKTLKVT